MARRGRPKKQKTEADYAKEPARIFSFVGGPRDGDEMRLVNPPPPALRLAMPEWCTYEWNETKSVFEFVGDKPIPRSVWDQWSYGIRVRHPIFSDDQE